MAGHQPADLFASRWLSRTLTQLLAPPMNDVPDVVVSLPSLAGYDELIEVSL